MFSKMKPKSKTALTLFLFSLPFLLLVFAFSYVPLFGWVYAFFDYKPGLSLSQCEFVGWKHFISLVQNPVLVDEMLRVLKNTFGISLLTIITTPLPAIFAIMIHQCSAKRYKKVVQTLTTLPNFISWVLMFSIAWSMFSIDDGFINRILLNMGVIDEAINFMGSGEHVWLSMTGYMIWKTLGWNAIMYLAAITSIDEELYEAAKVDGAGRFAMILHITIPGLMSTFFVLLLMQIANFLNNGVDQYYVFQNAMNKNSIEVLDLYVYNMGIAGSNISPSIAVGMLKSIISIVLLFSANQLSKVVRGEKIF